jgi:hypothetical protein
LTPMPPFCPMEYCHGLLEFPPWSMQVLLEGAVVMVAHVTPPSKLSQPLGSVLI